MTPCTEPVSLAFLWHPLLGGGSKAGGLGEPNCGQKGAGMLSVTGWWLGAV